MVSRHLLHVFLFFSQVRLDESFLVFFLGENFHVKKHLESHGFPIEAHGFHESDPEIGIVKPSEDISSAHL